jgi:uncharacterized membrane protein
MSFFKRSGGQIVLAVLAIVSLAVSIYLTIVHYNTANVPLVCSSTGFVNCENVLASSYSLIPGTQIPVSIAGILWSLAAIALPLIGLIVGPDVRLVRLGTSVWGGIGLLSVFYFVYAEIVLIHYLCAWCTVVHVLVLIYLLLSVFMLQGPVVYEDQEDVYDEEIADVSTRQ